MPPAVQRHGPSLRDWRLTSFQNALAVFQKLGDKNFEVFCLQVIAAYYRQTGRHADAERELNRAMAVARERDLQDDAVSLTIDLARSQIEAGAYAAAWTKQQRSAEEGAVEVSASVAE